MGIAPPCGFPFGGCCRLHQPTPLTVTSMGSQMVPAKRKSVGTQTSPPSTPTPSGFIILLLLWRSMSTTPGECDKAATVWWGGKEGLEGGKGVTRVRVASPLQTFFAPPPNVRRGATWCRGDKQSAKGQGSRRQMHPPQNVWTSFLQQRST